MKAEYEALLESAAIICAARKQVKDSEGSLYMTPAWKMLAHAEDYVLKLAEEIFRAEEVRA